MKKYFVLLFLLLPSLVLADSPTILVNEIAWMGTAESANNEWLELYNATDSDVSLDGWRLEAMDDSPKILLAGTIPAKGYFLLERTDDNTLPNIAANQFYTGSLGNNGEWLKLYDSNGFIVDEIQAATGWPGGDNTTKQTMERITATTWQTSALAGGTPKAANSMIRTPQNTTQNTQGSDTASSTTSTVSPRTSSPMTSEIVKRGDIVITELLPDPVGPDTDTEFIELKNVSRTDIDLTAWKLRNAAGQTFTLPSLSMSPDSIVVFYRLQTKLALNNTKDKIVLTTTKNKIIDDVAYRQAVTGSSYAINNQQEYEWTVPTPGRDNQLTSSPMPVIDVAIPKTVRLFDLLDLDASDSFDPTGGPLELDWSFGDGHSAHGFVARQIYVTSGTFTITITAHGAHGASTTEQYKITVPAATATADIVATPATTTLQIAKPVAGPRDNIFISEFLPNPVGNDRQGEFIELYNANGDAVDISGWQLDDGENGSRPYHFPTSTVIGGGQYRAFFATETKLNLNNNGDEIRLSAPDGTIVDQTSYTASKEGVSYGLTDNGSWQETAQPTPNQINTIISDTATTVTTTSPQVLGASTSDTTNPARNRTVWAFGFGGVTILLLAALKWKNWSIDKTTKKR